MKKLLILLPILVLGMFVLAACGGDDEESSDTSATEETTSDGGGGGGGGTVTVEAVSDGSFAYEQSELSAPAGSATFEFTNPASLGHDFCVEAGGEDLGCSELVADGESSTLDAELESGTEYTYYCSVAGHREGGMEGTITVE